MRLTVTRGEGMSPAPDELTAELACSEAPATQAGRVYLDGAAGPDRVEAEIAALPATSDGVRLPGEIVAVDDGERAGAWNAYVTGFSLSLTADAETGAVSLGHTYVVERPLG